MYAPLITESRNLFTTSKYPDICKKKIPQSGICPAPCWLRQCARYFRLSFYQRMSSVKGRLLSKIVFRQRSSSVKGRLPSKVVFRQRSSSSCPTNQGPGDVARTTAVYSYKIWDRSTHRSTDPQTLLYIELLRN